MSDEIAVPVTLPLDLDGFLRRECPTCERQFKWFNHEQGDAAAELVDQYFCPLCGVPAGLNAWWTPEQLEHMQASAGPQLDEIVQESLTEAFKGLHGLSLTVDRDFTLGIDAPEPLVEPDDMVIVEPPCHPAEPVKVPEADTARVHCLICGQPFSA